ncbi:DUF4405 domain-containing protein [Breznakiella homolactica]|uniref:DUF4405 domain-containing protein n=1 Tax=Breznakiella homolactica TaxID=2798577 RepID=A0A7T8B8V6_9SPIR|nr:DUF4405 domain-containing protein [Breznakiella homolactica]QQO07787.1 DUF4405 domain-containing protein [Breznakiella homolactica]
MNKRRLIKGLIDAAMAVCLFLLMAYKMAPNGLHEFAGIVFFILAILHCVLNRFWFTALFKGKYTVRRILGTAANVLLLTALAVQIITALPISETVFAFLGLAKDRTSVVIHGVAGTWMFVMGFLHLGFHWDAVVRAFRRRLGSAADHPVAVWLFRAAAAALMAWGVKASFDRAMGSRLIFNAGLHAMYSDPSVFRFIRDYLAIGALYTGAVYFGLKLLQKN